MTDEQRPCKHGPWAYRGDFQSGVQYCVGCGVDATALVNVERTRADAAEAQRDRLQREVDQLSDGFWREHRPATSDEHGIDGRIHGYCRRCIKPWPCEYSPDLRAALADVPDAASEINARTMDRIRQEDDRARRRDEAYRAMVEVCERLRSAQGTRGALLDAGYQAELHRALALARQVEA